ncbi:MAG TPA: molybdopterin-dependent oxidoreductase [Acidimicrobiia bacterium]|jgi:anaerobic selenocysteine-containing dehydrogenase|nr:molybdopterin-dependent oxidoreductase [Acidimicrobiia bacterium]
MSLTEDVRTVRGACPHDCPDTCAMLVTVENGKATKVRGDPDHPFTQGGLCVKVNDYTNHTYSPNRVLYPLRRVSPKGQGQFERITWDEALDEIATRFQGIIDEYGGQAILPYSYLGTEGILNGLTVGDPFFHRLGATVSERTFCDSSACTAYFMTLGPTAGLDPESFVHSRYILLWACNIRSTNLHMWPFIKEAQERGAKVVAIDPLRHRTAQSADWYIPIRPGTDAALALGMMHVIIAEGLVDEDYVANYTVGFEDLAKRVQEYPPERVSEITGIPVDDIITLAREYATTQPSAIRVGVAIERQVNGGQAMRAIASLPAMVGAWRNVGGGILQLPLWAFPLRWDVLQRPELIQPGTRVVNQWHLGPALTGELGLDPPIKGLFVYNSNPVIMAPNQAKTLAGLAREDLFTVVSEQYLTDTADYADIVLPATTQLEQFDIMFSWGHMYVSLNQPAIEPLGEAVSNVEQFRRLTKRMGLEDDWYCLSDEEMALRVYDWSAPTFQGITLDLLKEKGWARLNLPDRDHYAPHAEGHFPTGSGKCEFYSTVAEQAGNFVVPVFREGYTEFQPGNPVDPLPGYVPPEEDLEGGPYPLKMISPKSHAFLSSQYGNMDYQRRVQGEQTLIINADDAEARGIDEGQPVRVFNERGEIQAVARIGSGDLVARGVVVCSVGQWRKLNPGAATVNAINRTAFGDMGNNPTFSDTRVEVAPIEES